MTTVSDASEHGWIYHGNGIMTNLDGVRVLDTLIGETGQLYVKRLGDDDVYKPYSSDKHSSNVWMCPAI